MATPNLTEEEVLFRRRARRRLVGAIVLVVIAVAVVPMILPEKRPQQDAQQIDIRIPAQDASGYAPKIIAAPAPVIPAASAVSAVESKPAPAPEAVKAEAPKPQAVEAKPVEAKPVDAKPAEPPKAAHVAEKGAVSAKPASEAPAKSTTDAKQTYFVQYGAFSELKNAKQKQAELKAKGITTFTEVVKTSGGDKIRVRSGPYAARDLAEKVRTKVKPVDSKLVVVGANG